MKSSHTKIMGYFVDFPFKLVFVSLVFGADCLLYVFLTILFVLSNNLVTWSLAF